MCGKIEEYHRLDFVELIYCKNDILGFLKCQAFDATYSFYTIKIQKENTVTPDLMSLMLQGTHN